MLQQLRIYKIEQGKYDEFLQHWLTGVYPARQAFGWDIQAWTVRETGELVWLLSLDCTLEEWQQQERIYYDSPERKSLNPDPGSYVVTKEERWIEALSPERP